MGQNRASVKLVVLNSVLALALAGCSGPSQSSPLPSGSANPATTNLSETTVPTAVTTSQPLITAGSLATAVDPFVVNQGLARTLNLGAVFEVGRGETWGNDFEPADLDSIAAAGFSAVRVPIRWSDWASRESPFIIEAELFDQIDAVVDRAATNQLHVIIDVHHYEELDANPTKEAERFLSLWGQIADHYQEAPASVVFELANEPHDAFSGAELNNILAEAVDVIRGTNPNRTIMIGPDQWYSPLRLPMLELPDDDNLIVTVHYYEPFPFTHQGAVWVDGADQWLGTPFIEPDDRLLIEAEFAAVAEWAQAANRPVFIGEFGSLDGADKSDRLAWTSLVRQQSEAYGFAWAYWDWATPGFGIYSHELGEWDQELLEALLGP